MLPAAVESALKKLGQDLRIARKRRKESLASWSVRMQVSVPTVQKMESGDPTVSMAAYATALWLAGKSKSLGEIASPSLDNDALGLEIRALLSTTPA